VFLLNKYNVFHFLQKAHRVIAGRPLEAACAVRRRSCVLWLDSLQIIARSLKLFIKLRLEGLLLLAVPLDQACDALISGSKRAHIRDDKRGGPLPIPKFLKGVLMTTLLADTLQLRVEPARVRGSRGRGRGRAGQQAPPALGDRLLHRRRRGGGGTRGGRRRRGGGGTRGRRRRERAGGDIVYPPRFRGRWGSWFLDEIAKSLAEKILLAVKDDWCYLFQDVFAIGFHRKFFQKELFVLEKTPLSLHRLFNTHHDDGAQMTSSTTSFILKLEFPRGVILLEFNASSETLRVLI